MTSGREKMIWGTSRENCKNGREKKYNGRLLLSVGAATSAPPSTCGSKGREASSAPPSLSRHDPWRFLRCVWICVIAIMNHTRCSGRWWWCVSGRGWGVSSNGARARFRLCGTWNGLLARMYLRGWTLGPSWRTFRSRRRWKGRMGIGSSPFVTSAGRAGLVHSRI